MNFKPVLLCSSLALLLSACGSPGPSKPPRSTPAPVSEIGSPAPASTPVKPAAGGGGFLPGDGMGDTTTDFSNVPDAVPRAETLHPYANRPYEALGQTYSPLQEPGHYKQRGIASWYGKKFHGQRTSSGETYDMYGMTAAHTILPIPSYARVTNVSNGKSVVVRINDRGPFLHDRIIDLSYAAAYKLGIIGSGSAEVEVESIDPGNVASGGATTTPLVVAPPVTSVAEPAPDAAALPVGVAAPGSIYLQFGAFRFQPGAESLLTKLRGDLGDMGRNWGLFHKDDGLIRVLHGPYPNEDMARQEAERLADKVGFKPVLSRN